MYPLFEKYTQAWTEDSIRLIVTPSPVAKGAFFYVQEVGHFRTLKPYYTERENLESYLVAYTLSGKGYLTYEKKNYTLSAGQVFFIDCMNRHRYWTDADHPWELLWVHLYGSSIRQYFEHYAAANGSAALTLKQDAILPHTIQQLIKIHSSKSLRTEIISAKIIVNLLTDLLLAAQQFDTLAPEMPDYIKRIIHDLDTRYHQKITLDMLAEQYAFNKYHLAKEFKRCTGFSPGEYLITTRISRAKELLEYSDHSVNEIAGRIGIDNVSHFINLFKRHEGQTPLSYRKKWQKNR